MASEVEVYETSDGAGGAETPGPAPVPAPDPLKEVRDLKRWTQAGVYLAIVLTFPFYYFAAGYSLVQDVIAFIMGLIIATVAIEGAFNQMLKLRKRSAYPGVVVMELGGVHVVAAAAQHALPVAQSLLGLQASFLALRGGTAELSLVSVSGMSRVAAERFLQVGMPNLRQALRDRQPVPFNPSSALLLEAMLGRNERLVFVPVVALRKPIGVLALLGHDGNGDLKDGQLLRGIGIALGLSLENLRQKEELREMAAIDELTKVYNRRHFFEQLEREMAAAQRYDSPLALLIVDLDGLKYINDNFGHSAGDGALRTVAQCLVRFSRAADLVARLGGDEFAVILPRTDKEGATDIGARLQQAVSQSPLYVAEGVSAPLTISCGCGAFPEDAPDIEGLLRQADGSMYGGKAARRTAASR